MNAIHRSKIAILTAGHRSGEGQRLSWPNMVKLFYALRDNNVPVEFIAYPIDGHFPADPIHQRDVLDRWIAWIEKHFEK